MNKAIENFNNAEHPVAFFISDLHGVYSHSVVFALYDQGYDALNENHFVIVCGDITDGFGQDDQLIECLRSMEKNDRTIIVKGNHDIQVLNDRPSNSVSLKPENKQWLKELPYQVVTKHCYISHGMYIDKLKGFHEGIISTYACAALFNLHHDEWWWVDEKAVKLIHKRWKNIDKYVDWLDRPSYCGHFWPQAIKDKFIQSNKTETNKHFWSKFIKRKPRKRKYELIEDEEGFVSYGKQFWVDSNVFQGKRAYISDKMSRRPGTVKAYRKEF